MYRHILVPLDGSELAEQVLPHVHALAANEGTTKITLLRAVPPIFTTSVDYSGMLATTTEAITQMEQEALDYLKHIAKQFQSEGYEVHTEISALPPAEAIIEYAENHNVDLIVIATHGRSGLSRWVFGSVTQKVVQVAPTPVLVIRPRHDHDKS
ncbi:MAG TPA: universal stress protein [Chloroflexus aurantiacus]|mgnify:FL=1|jgi:nucleotide-binding universal stress UspA family protein|uniref:Universal stress protein n=1 Tax=Chloroflexus aurantiacus (strain ATCC 29366 / DSM 635 / J-10-fl) TaxID=324602 RepID=A9WJJ1_CHLAA|nr:universal stress protein [Chloroflexus aurantiacus]ABY35895.1 UspA domain protein [Chloroflexus aurantiacus J-10-fl]HBW69237.1 universal stress protein [Chloroflexus aurantiacus]